MPPVKKKTAKKKISKKISKKTLAEKAARKRNAWKKIKGPVYGVPWIEVEFGQRDEGWALYLDKAACIKHTKLASDRGPYSDGGGYLGPERPLHYYEIPVEGLDKEYLKALAEKGSTHTSNHWRPKYKGPIQHIRDGK